MGGWLGLILDQGGHAVVGGSVGGASAGPVVRRAGHMRERLVRGRIRPLLVEVLMVDMMAACTGRGCQEGKKGEGLHAGEKE